MSEPNPKWLDAATWKTAQATLPICCVDVLPVRLGTDGRLERVGLILRDAITAPRRWCLVGGRLFRDESLIEAAARQIRSTLGAAVRFSIAPDATPAHIAEYFAVKRENALHDPRQHAVALTFVVSMEGTVAPCGEALDFRWFAPADLPPVAEFGFGQDAVVRACLKGLLTAQVPTNQ